MVNLATAAHARAFLICNQGMQSWIEGLSDEPFTWEGTLAAVFALDGVRCCFEELRDQRGAALARDEFVTWAGEWPDESWGLVQLVDIHFRETAAFLRGLREGGGGATTSDRAEEYLARQRE